MRAVRTNAIRSRLSALLASLAGLCAIAGLMASNVLAADEPRAPLQIQLSLDRPIDAAAAPFVMATTGGLFSAEALAVTTNIASGSADAIARVAAGTSDFALVDINELMRKQMAFNDELIRWAQSMSLQLRSLESAAFGIRAGVDARMRALEQQVADLKAQLEKLPVLEPRADRAAVDATKN